MNVSVEPLQPSELAAFIARSNAEFRRERIEAGDSEAYADERVAQSNAQYFPEGRPAEGHLVLAVLAVLAEEQARAHGAVKLGLNVFGHNTVARGLYESLGYDITAITMAKAL